MNEQQARQIVADALGEVAPDADFDALDPAADLQRTADLDSMDLLTLLDTVAARIGIDIPDADSARLVSIDSFVGYLCERTGA